MGGPAILEGWLILILCKHSTEIDAIAPPCLSLKQCVSRRSVYQRNIIWGWFHVIINLQPLIPDKGNLFCPIGGIENTSINWNPWGRLWGGRVMGLWWRRVRIFFKEAFSCPILLDDRKPLVTMECLPGNGSVSKENGCV